MKTEKPDKRKGPKAGGADAPATEPPKKLTSDRDRENARRMRDRQWELMERVAALAPEPLWICWWNKNRHHGPSPSAQYSDGSGYREDLLICGLIDGIELLEWMRSHNDWWVIGAWSDERYAAPVTLTDAGRVALANRERYDMEPVTGGLVEPGWEAIPAPKGE